jgi:hypothetical protein
MEFAFPQGGNRSELMTPVGAAVRSQEFYYARELYLGCNRRSAGQRRTLWSGLVVNKVGETFRSARQNVSGSFMIGFAALTHPEGRYLVHPVARFS